MTPKSEHVCKPDAKLYLCQGEIESSCHGGFDVCCDEPEKHVPVYPTPVVDQFGGWD